MLVGHINLETSMNGTGEHFIRLVEALNRQGIEQHVLVANQSLAKRVNVYDGVTTGPVVKTPIMAYCLMPDVRVVHAHDHGGGQAGLLMTLTRSTPYVLTRRSAEAVGKNPIARSMVRRASGLICPSAACAAAILDDDFAGPIDIIEDISHERVAEAANDNRIAAEHLRIYRRSTEAWQIPALLL